MKLTVFKSERGATLVESVVAIALASIVLTAIVGMVVSAVATSTLSKSRTSATRYAEEAVEVARKTRDRTDWDNFYNTYVNSTAWKVDGTLNLTSGDGLSIAPFTRTVSFTNASSPPGARDRVQVEVKVTWLDKGQTQEVALVTFLTEWYRATPGSDDDEDD